MTMEQSFLMWSMIGALGTAVFTGLLALFACLAWRAAANTLDQMKKEAKESAAAQQRHLGLIQRDMDSRQQANTATLEHLKADSAAQTRPYVHAELGYSVAGGKAWDIIIRNTGRSMARNLRAELDGWPHGPADQVVQDAWTLLSTPRTLPPDTIIRALWNLGPRADGTTPESAVGFSASRVITFYYDDAMGKSYVDTFELDLDSLSMTPGPYGGVSWRNASRHEKKMSDITRAIHALRYRQ
ncbi:hypothetical protein [Micrococcus terreus]|uniref:hypothetical protein n=1 Tax=Micrococcus terreus TaxID=574650 RepID=UPI00254AB590|nr:hypothetical protein [Micrococcus terreus]MDK7701188.1 hypothetical protein [Micrococcus terreus]WOO97803.1 hypothetical protein R3I42_01070 [Micrococcus terreus]